jgi:hypothetical protein
LSSGSAFILFFLTRKIFIPIKIHFEEKNLQLIQKKVDDFFTVDKFFFAVDKEFFCSV